MASASIERVATGIEKIPWLVVLASCLAGIGYNYYNFLNDSGSALNVAKARLETTRQDNKRLQGRLKEAYEFSRTFEEKRVELRNLASQLQDMKAYLTDEINEPLFMKMVVQEAAKVGLTVRGIKPETPKPFDFYMEQPFELHFSGYYVQLLVFLNHLASSERIVRVDDYELNRTGSGSAPYVELSGTIWVKAYKYMGSKADELAEKSLKNGAAAVQPSPAGGTSQETPKGG